MFGRDKEATISGTDVLREATRARIHKGYAALYARDLQIGIAALDSFANGKGMLPPEVMTKLSKIVFGDNCSFDAERNLLVRTPAPSTPMPAYNHRFEPPAHLKGDTRSVWERGPYRPASEAPEPPKPRAGWAK